MAELNRKIKNLMIMILMLGVCVLCVTSAWATLSFVKPGDTTPDVTKVNVSQIPSNVARESKARAPEPATMALFGGGFLGMLMGFVRRTYATIKRILDSVAAVVGIVLLSPLFLFATILIKLTSKGPILFKQVRVGKDGELFEIYKFRTMRVDAEKETGPVWAAQNDNRLIPVGKFLRKAHIDEIPQFFNILKGEMSLIGPRPERPVFVKQFKKEITGYEKRLAVKPGITGLAQVWHKYDETIEDVKKKIRYDLLYIKKYCLWTDVRILLRTFRVVFTGEGAR